MKISLKPILPAAFGLLTLSACSNVNDRAKEYFANKPYAEYQDFKTKDATTRQSCLDSMAYRDIFNSTNAAKDSALVAEFDSIAQKIRGYKKEDAPYARIFAIQKSIIDQGIQTKEYEEVTNGYSWHDDDLRRANITQHKADDWAYKRFFKKAGILNDRIIAKCKEVSEKICP